MGPVEGAVFADYGTDLASGPTVPGMYLWSDVFFFLFFASVLVPCPLPLLKGNNSDTSNHFNGRSSLMQPDW